MQDDQSLTLDRPVLSAVEQSFRIVNRAHSTVTQPLDLAQEFGDAVERDLGGDGRQA